MKIIPDKLLEVQREKDERQYIKNDILFDDFEVLSSLNINQMNYVVSDDKHDKNSNCNCDCTGDCYTT
ncbi:hypothetical protein [Emticicia sp. BO119]|uniref:hypothetical protein n=1 Tax=Emticicia sp. BO119 TaxID=2757768 RepID=UPI0015F0F348|nr:hypothetical protein [Emticicia sp. BO119]MBA4853758.1 hypothetical protein [Emticicia sp. BO119]